MARRFDLHFGARGSILTKLEDADEVDLDDPDVLPSYCDATMYCSSLPSGIVKVVMPSVCFGKTTR